MTCKGKSKISWMQCPPMPEAVTCIDWTPPQSKSSLRLDCVRGTLSYKIPENKSEAGPGTCIFFDTEAVYDPDTAYETGQFQRLRLGCAIGGRLEAGKWTREKRLNFTTGNEFWEWVEKQSDPRRPIWMFAHNIGYDLALVGLPEKLVAGDFKIFDDTAKLERVDVLKQKYIKTKGFVCLDNPPVILSLLHKTNWKLVCVDTFNFWTTSLEKMGEKIGLPKLAIPKLIDSLQQWHNYCMNDVEIVKAVVLELVDWIKTNDLGKFRFTAPSQAMAAFRHRWNRPAIKTHNNVALRKFERESYYGGRLECFYIGKVSGKLYELDVTSLYPSVMQSELFPSKLVDFCLPTTHTSIRQVTPTLNTIATVRIKTNVGMPKKVKGLGTIYPIGEYWTTLAGPELMRAYSDCRITDMKGWAIYELQPIFRDFVEFFWNYRLSQQNIGNQIRADLAKLMMNGLYGKFGQLTSAWSDRPDIKASGKIGYFIEPSMAGKSFPWFREIGTCVQQFTGKQEHPYAFPAIAAYVTSYAREYMRLLRQLAGNNHVYYMVTDALFTDHIGYRNLQYNNMIADNELGKLRVKHEADTAEFAALHHYKIGEHAVNGSRKKSARPNPDGSFTEIQFESFEKILLRKPDGSVHVKPVNKRYSKEYTRGTLLEDGWVEPLQLME